MATQKPISTISYNSEPFLREKLDTWIQAHIIQAYMYICHKGEDGDKDHIHLRIEPNKKLDPMTLADELLEYPIGSQKPLGVRPFRPSKEEDWILYAVHDPEYLSLKYQNDKGEKLPYAWNDIRVPDNYDMEIAYIRAKSSIKHSTVNIAKTLRSGTDPLKMILEGENPYIVGTILKLMGDTDYKRLLAENASLRSELLSIRRALDARGLSLVQDDDGNYFIP